MNTLSPSPSELDAPDSFASLPPTDRARAWVAAAEAATGDDRRSESYAEAAHAFAEAGDSARAVECLDALLSLAEPKVRAAQRGVDAATALGEHGRALRLYTWVLPTITLDDKRASTAVTLADEAAKLADRPLERFFLREAMGIRRSEELLARFAQSAVASSREEGALDEEDRTHAVLSLVHLARRHAGEHGFAYAASALGLDPRNDDALELFVDRGVEAELHDAVRERLEAAVFVLGAERQSVALGRLAASLDERRTGVLPGDPGSAPAIPSIVDVDELEAAPAEVRDARVEALLAEAASLQSFPSLHVTKLREVLVLDPLEPQALAELRKVLASRGDHEGLREVLVEAAEAAKARRWPVSKRLPIVRELAELCAVTLDDPIGAIEALEELVRSDARNAEARTALRGHLERVGRWDAVVKLLEEGLATAAAPADALAELARIHLERRRDAAAAAAVLLRRAQLLGSDVAAWRELLQLVRSLRDSAKLEATLVEVLETVGAALTTTERAAMAEELAGLRKSAGDLAGAEKLYTDAALGTRDARLFAAAERCACDLGAFERAARAALAQADLSGEQSRAEHLVRASSHFAETGARKLTLATLRDAVAAGASPDIVAPVLDRCAREDAAETFEWVATLALRTQRDRLGWLARAEALAGGQTQSPRAVSLVKELLRLEPTVERLRLLAPLPWASDEDLRAVVHDVAARAELPAPLRSEAALLSARASKGAGDREGALRVLRALPRPYESRIVAELLDLGTGLLGAHEELELVEQALEGAEAGSETRRDWLERAAGLATARHDSRRELRYTLELLELDPDDFDRLTRATRLARDLADDAILDRCLARAIEVEADDDALAALVKERAGLLESKLGRVDDALALLAEHATTVADLCVAWVALAERHGRESRAAEVLARFEALGPAESAVESWLERLPSSDDWLALAKVVTAKATPPSRRALALALARGAGAHARELFALAGPAAVPQVAVEEARSLAGAGLRDEAFASVSAHVSLPRAERPDAIIGLALDLAPTAIAAIGTLVKVDGLPSDAFHDGLADILGRVGGGVDAVAAALAGAGERVDVSLLAERTSDARVIEALVGDERPRPLESHRALIAATERVGSASAIRVDVRAAAWAAHPALAEEADAPSFTATDRIAALERAVLRAPASEPLAVALTHALLEAGRVEEAQGIATGLVDRNAGHRELLEGILEQRGQVHELVASLEKRWSLEKDAGRRIAIARRIAETLERTDADPREVADAWRRVLRLDAKDSQATAALDRAKARALGAMRASLSAPPPPPVAAPSSTNIAAATPPPIDARPAASVSEMRTATVEAPAEESPAASVEGTDAPARAATLSMTAAHEFEESSDDAPPSPVASATELAEVDDESTYDSELDRTTAGATRDDVPLELTSATEIPEAIESSELLDDAALESIPDAEELA